MDELDVTQKTRAAEERLGLLQMAETMSGVGHWRLEASGSVLWSPEVYRIHGVTPSDFNPSLNSALDFYHPDDRRLVSEHVERALGEGAPFSFELRLLRSDGEVRHVICKAACERDGRGVTAAVSGVFQDVTEHVRDVETVKRSERRYRLLAENMGDVITRIRLDGSSSYISPGIEPLLGFKPEEMRGRSAQAFVHKDDRPFVMAAFAQIAQGADRVTLQHRACHKDGRTVWVESQFKRVLKVTGAPPELVAVIRDISDRKAAEDAARESDARYRLLADNANDMIARMKPGGEILLVTPGCRQVLGFEAQELVGRRTVDLMHTDDLPGVGRYFATLQSLGPGGRLEPYRFRARHKSGHWVWLEGQPKMFFDTATGAPIEVQDVVRDISARKALEVQLDAARQEAEAATRVKSEFLSNISHELRTPLTSILGFSALLNDTPGLSDLARRSVDRITGSSEALLTIVNDVLDFSKLETGQVEIDAKPVDLQNLLSNAVALLEPQAQAKSLNLSFNGSGPMPKAVLLDVGRVRQVLLNLVGNAVKFTSTGSVRVEATYDGIAQRLRCEIVDQGIGIPADRIDRLFKRFSQVDASTTRSFGGTGLGLAICKGLVEAMGGEIGVYTPEGGGACFWFELPCPAARPAGVISDPHQDQAVSSLTGVRILLADDNPLNRELVRCLLAPCGVEVTEADGGLRAMSLADTEPFDLILLDVRMPDLDGPHVAHAIRSGGGPNDGVPILAFTAENLRGRIDPAWAGLFDDVIAKPIVLGDLVDKVSRWADPFGSFEDGVASHG